MNELELEPLGDRAVIFEPLNGALPEAPRCLLWPLWFVIFERCPAELHDPATEWALKRDWSLIALLNYDAGVPLVDTASLRRMFIRTWHAAWPRIFTLGLIFVVNGSEQVKLPDLHKRDNTTLGYCLAQYLDHHAIDVALSTDEVGPAALIDAEGNPLDPSLLLKERDK